MRRCQFKKLLDFTRRYWAPELWLSRLCDAEMWPRKILQLLHGISKYQYMTQYFCMAQQLFNQQQQFIFHVNLVEIIIWFEFAELLPFLLS